MLKQILDYIHNYFIKEIHRGRFVIVNGTIPSGIVQNDQYFCIKGSIFNDGLYQYPTENLNDEEFEGEIWALAIPKDVIDITREVEGWVAKYGNTINSPFNSESFGGYSYTKSHSGADAKSSNSSWQGVFSSKLDVYRKIS